MKRKFNVAIFLIIYFVSSFINIYDSFAAIDVTVSPIRYEITLNKWDVTTKSVKVFNNSNTSQEIFVTTRNAIWMDENWQPKFVEEIAWSKYHLADWITPWISEFVLWPWKSIDIPFSIRVYRRAQPGWHYWAIFFNVKEWAGWQINVQKRIWVLILLKVPWVVNAEWEVKWIVINVSNWWWWALEENRDVDLLWKIFRRYVLWEKDTELTSAPDQEKKKRDKKTNPGWEDFSVDLTIDFSNVWNTHLKPKWTIEILDENWKPLKKIWKETIKNEAWAIVWEKVVDYIPVNDEDWNVLPNENRKFKQSWQWFAYETLDENGKKIIKYRSPWEYYSSKNKSEKWYLMPWEKEYTKETKQKLTAKIKLEYTDPNWKEVEFNSSREFYVNYLEDYIWFNRLVIIPFTLFVILFIIYIIFILPKRKKKKEKELEEKILKKLKHDEDIDEKILKKLKHDEELLKKIKKDLK